MHPTHNFRHIFGNKKVGEITPHRNDKNPHHNRVNAPHNGDGAESLADSVCFPRPCVLGAVGGHSGSHSHVCLGDNLLDFVGSGKGRHRPGTQKVQCNLHHHSAYGGYGVL